MPHAGFEHCSHLRRIHCHRQSQLVGTHVLIFIFECGDQFVGLPSEALLHKAANDGVLKHFVAVAVDVVPHQEFIEREYAEHRLFFNVPSGLIGDGFANDGEDEFHIHSMVIARQRIEFWDGDIEILSQKFYQCDVEHDFLLASANVVHAFLIHHIHRQHQYRRKSRHGAGVALIPSQSAYGKV